MNIDVADRALSALLFGFLGFAGNVLPVHAAIDLAQVPLFLRSSVVPNVMINLSVEAPMGGAAYNDQADPASGCAGRVSGRGVCYSDARTYIGYFDPASCYTYTGSATTGKLSVAGVDSEESGQPASNVADDDSETYWQSKGIPVTDDYPHHVEVVLPQVGEVIGLRYLPWDDGNGLSGPDGAVDSYAIYVEPSPIDFDNLGSYTPVASGSMDYAVRSDQQNKILFAAKSGRYIALVGNSSSDGDLFMAAREVTPILAPADDGSRYFQRAGPSAGHACSGQWSGNFLNWATMTAMDAFIYTMTGGNRIVDSSSQTIVRRARSTLNRGWFPVKRIDSAINVAPNTVTPFSDSAIDITNTDFGFRIESVSGTDHGTRQLAVDVCRAGSIEANCVAYESGGTTYHKPNGLLQARAASMRFATIGYALDYAVTRDGGVVRANMKHLGPELLDGTTNPQAEFTADGLLVSDPDGLVAADVDYSGVINYVNKFSDYGYKGFDPVSELFYETLRYFKNLGPTSDYVNGVTGALKGGFPVLTNWDDPIEEQCQPNYIIAINDAYPWRDKRLPGTSFSCGGPSYADDCGEPSNADSIDVTALANAVGQWEAIGNLGTRLAPANGSCLTASCTGNGRENSYYVAGLAHYANTTDLRGDFDDDQTVTTFMIDTQEYQSSPLVGQYNPLWLTGKYGGFDDENGNGYPDTGEWENATGEPRNYVLATRPEAMVEALSRAFDEVAERSASASSLSFLSGSLGATGNRTFQALFDSKDWSGTLQALEVNADGTLGSPVWVAGSAAWQSTINAGTRTVFTTDGSGVGGVAFTWAALDTAQQAALNDDSDLLDYLRGDQTNEIDTVAGSGRFRPRVNLLGDIVHASPRYVSRTELPYFLLPGTEGSQFRAFIEATEQRTPVVYVGANDGMLHAFNAADGSERFAYVPGSLLGELQQLAEPGYVHRYFVDGPLHVADAYVNGAWRTLLVSSLGAGGRAVYALDISDPSAVTAASVLWEFTDAGLGSVLGEAQIVRTNATGAGGNRWAVIFGNGYGSDFEQASLFVRFLDTRQTIRIDTAVGGPAASNGLAEPLLADVDRDLTVDFAYAGDLLGNLWKFDLSSADPTLWDSAFADANGKLPLFTATDAASPANAQPITSRPAILNHPQGGSVIVFGTGRYFVEGDHILGANPPLHTLYGVRDNNATVGGRSALKAQSIVYQGPFSVGDSTEVRVLGDEIVDYSQQEGWYIDLLRPGLLPSSAPIQQGERVISGPVIWDGRVLVNTFIPPASGCDLAGNGWLMDLAALHGNRTEEVVLDINDDGDIDENDGYPLTAGQDPVPVSGLSVAASIGLPSNVCVSGYCDKMLTYVNGEDGVITAVLRRGVSGGLGRQSWRQVR